MLRETGCQMKAECFLEPQSRMVHLKGLGLGRVGIFSWYRTVVLPDEKFQRLIVQKYKCWVSDGEWIGSLPCTRLAQI